MFSKTCEYAIRAMLFIAQKAKNGNKVGIKEIAKGIGSPEHFIAKILQDLSRKGFVQSVKGPNGGFYLDAKSANQTLADIVLEIDGGELFHGCAMGLPQCSEKHPCPLHNEFKKVRTDIKTMLEKTKIDELTGQLEKNLTYLRKK